MTPQQRIADLFGVQKVAISKHLKNIFASCELVESATVSKMEAVQVEGSRRVTRQIDLYNLDNWVGVETLDLLAKKRKGVPVTVVTSEHKDRRGKPRLTLAETDIAKFNAQYPSLMVRYGEKFHDRFRILDDEEIVRDRQKAYYRAISVADRTGDACEFIEFMLVALRDALVAVKKSVGKGVVKSRLRRIGGRKGGRWEVVK